MISETTPSSLPVSEAASSPKNRSLLIPVPRGTQVATFSAILFPFLAVIAAPLFVKGWGFSGVDLALLVGCTVFSMMGITVGFHRLFTHSSFDAPIWVKSFFAVLGSLAIQGSLFTWVATHRLHHQHSDTPNDPHSPHHHGKSFWGIIRGAIHSHMSWLFAPTPPNLERYIKDLHNVRALRIIDSLFPLWILLSFLIPAGIGGLATLSWKGALTGFIWGGLVRLFLAHHITWSINSACHIWGSQPFPSKDQSRNNFVFGILALGEGWHNAHHAFPRSARHGLRWWELDFSYGVILLLSMLGLAWDIRLPDAKQIAAASSR